MFYTGIGSRETPEHILELMTRIATILSEMGYTLRSGGANGADLAFEEGATSKEIYLPWPKFNNSSSDLVYGDNYLSNYIAKDLHPTWHKLTQGPRKLMSRNVNQVIGTDFNSPSEFILCWTPDACEEHTTRTRKTGGTGLAISLASNLGIPVYNLNNKKSLATVLRTLDIE